ncbi:MAG: phage tail sheath family protein [Oscillatoriales cyanobacterium RU_3_3]|nr:phage tail sheath family protein [Oscillatoriales cyanobacterium RU_3_3]NJR26475.1 phage tail sheath family protein [Richelia sp. CSU_2_1]
MPTYLSPGVYVEEIASGIAPIAGVGTSIAGFIGEIAVEGTNKNYTINLEKVEGEKVGTGNGEKKDFDLSHYPVLTTAGSFKVKVGETENTTVSIVNADRKSQISFTTAPTGEITVDYQPIFKSVEAGEVKLCTNFGDFKKFFGDFSNIDGQNTLAHAVYGFFNNGGTRCYVVWVTDKNNIDTALNPFEAIDEIAIVAAPGMTDSNVQGKIKDHCTNLGDRFAIFDCKKDADVSTVNNRENKPDNSNYAAFYFPWIQVFDPATKGQKPVPPSGHIAGIYARVDTQRGVHKAPANEVVMGALGLSQKISKNQQDGLNPQGINCIRDLNGNIRVWGARTIGGDANGEFKYINIRRLFNYLRESIDEGTQWTVFEPNSPDLWARIRRTVNAFLLTVWRSGALFGTTPEQAFFVKCDEENNPPEVRDAGQVIIEIGVAVVKPAEFVIFRISQWGGPGSK